MSAENYKSRSLTVGIAAILICTGFPIFIFGSIFGNARLAAVGFSVVAIACVFSAVACEFAKNYCVICRCDLTLSNIAPLTEAIICKECNNRPINRIRNRVNR